MKSLLTEKLKIMKEAQSLDFKSLDLDRKVPGLEKKFKKIKKLLKKARIKLPSNPKEPEIGQIWTTKKPSYTINDHGPFGPKNFLLTVVEKDGDDYFIMGVPISSDWMFAGMEDMVVVLEDNPFYIGKRFMLQLWAEIPIPKEALDKYLGRISPEIFSAVQTVLAWLGSGGEKIEYDYVGTELENEEDTPWDTYPLMKWGFKDPVTGKWHIVRLGESIRDKEDPRNEFRKMEVEHLRYLEIPVQMLEPRVICISDFRPIRSFQSILPQPLALAARSCDLHSEIEKIKKAEKTIAKRYQVKLKYPGKFFLVEYKNKVYAEYFPKMNSSPPEIWFIKAKKRHKVYWKKASVGNSYISSKPFPWINSEIKIQIGEILEIFLVKK